MSFVRASRAVMIRFISQKSYLHLKSFYDISMLIYILTAQLFILGCRMYVFFKPILVTNKTLKWFKVKYDDHYAARYGLPLRQCLRVDFGKKLFSINIIVSTTHNSASSTCCVYIFEKYHPLSNGTYTSAVSPPAKHQYHSTAEWTSPLL